MNNKKVLHIRQFLKMTQEEFAEMIGVTRELIALIETNRAPVSRNVASRIAHNFEVTDDFLSYAKRRDEIDEFLKTK